ncbi:MAG: FecR family protein [Bacteroidota bacterium]
MSKSEYDRKWLNDELSDEERKAFEGTEEHQFLNRLQSALNQFKAPDFDISKQESRLEENFKEHSTKIINWPTTFFKVAASLLLLISVYAIYQLNNDATIEPLSVYSTKKSNLYLPDSSYVALNAQTKLTYDWTTSRSVELQGEAFFKIKKGSQFDVVTNLGTVSVLGTQFNVEAWDNFFEVTCFEGTVKVVTDTREIILHKQESWRMIDGKSQSLHSESGVVPDWQKGESRFQSVPLKYVLKELERQYDIAIKTNNVELDQQFTGAFPHDNINLALKSISVPLKLSYRLEENQVKISNN